MKEIKKDILTVKEGVICQQVNCKGKMGAGIALSIRKKWSRVYGNYLNFYREGNLKLGSVQVIRIENNLWVANLAGQDRYGRDKRYTDYDALEICLKKINNFSIKEKVVPVYFPYKMGCSNAGGDWKIVKEMIEKNVEHSVICKK